MRQLLCFLLILCLPLQSIAAQWKHAAGPDATSLRHQLAHDARVQHHHDGDGTVHYDQSDESAKHVQDHAGCSQPAGIVLDVPRISRKAPLVTQAPPEPAAVIPDPIPDTPLRPPAIALG